ncbi:TonB-dependent receptor [Lysobacter sp. CFH 32150]|uniref:TonB-dependent receptor domain-containing protein n=1 Tax=Lysobacter sp. CFH 32150 TaxID=2927128 RepID=UPI001FA7A60E|nr:TonB-dependent receptor [Lysobacter sp. CFH 32150]MCI4569290.1 TonB-dependent receptor [Lysobacter sp. CFH 32150]
MPSNQRPARLPLVVAVGLILASPALLAATSGQDDQRHREPAELDKVIVKASPLAGTAEDLARPVEVLAGEKLDEAKANSLGETVSKLPGVQSSYFGPGVGRPIVRGFDGARVQVLSDGLSSGDVSTVSVDHAVSIEPFLADQIEVLKGPATLLYGSGAIGGAVNVVDGRIPEGLTDQPFQGRAELRGGTVNDEGTGMLRLDGSTSNFAFHFDALHRETGDYEIPGFAESAAQLASEGEEPDPAERGVLPNSALRTDSAALGLSWIGERGYFGFGSSLFNTRYGIPGHAHEHEGEEEPALEEGGEEGGVHIVLDQRRHELRGGFDGFGAFKSIRAKLARTEYTHTEFEGNEVGTVFDNDSTEGRVELVHKPWAGWDGAFGLQWAQRDFVAIGDEAFVPGTKSRDAGLFWFGEHAFGPLKLELGARHDRNKVDADDAIAIGPDRDFSTTSASAALKWEASDAFHLTFGLDRAQRSPTAEELYSNGLHVATASIELGTPTLDVETANRAELGLHWHSGSFQVGASVYHVRYDDFIYLADAGIDEHGGPIRMWTQGDARFDGAEAEVNWSIAENSSGAWDLRVFGDVVRGKLTGSGTRPVAFTLEHEGEVETFNAELPLSGNLPRMAPSRFGGELRWEREQWRASLGAVRYARQDRVAANETETAGYTLVDAHVAWHIDTAGGNAWEVFLDGSNLLDEEARAHTSFLKELAPLPGRGLTFGVRTFF